MPANFAPPFSNSNSISIQKSINSNVSDLNLKFNLFKEKKRKEEREREELVARPLSSFFRETKVTQIVKGEIRQLQDVMEVGQVPVRMLEKKSPIHRRVQKKDRADSWAPKPRTGKVLREDLR